MPTLGGLEIVGLLAALYTLSSLRIIKQVARPVYIFHPREDAVQQHEHISSAAKQAPHGRDTSRTDSTTAYRRRK